MPISSVRPSRDRSRLAAVLRGAVERETARLVSGEISWVSWLEQASRYGQYGFANTLLIGSQRPAASELLSYSQWQGRGRQVLRGETAIQILSTGGEPRGVFDITQTSGPSRPVGEPVADPAERWQRLVALAAQMELWIERNERWVYTGLPDKVIRVDAALDVEAAASVLAHQLAHVRLHRGSLDQADDGQAVCHGVRRVEADSVAYLLLHRLEVPRPPFSFPPVSAWAGEDERAHPSAAVRVVGSRVLTTASWFSKRLGEPTNTPPVQSPKAQPVTARRQAGPSRDELITIHAAAHELFLQSWAESWVPEYLAARGFSREVQRHWGIGFAPAPRRTMTEHLRHRGHSDAAILGSGLARQGHDGGMFDTFRDRAVLAIRFFDGTIAGFIGRVRDQGSGPKYLNSPASELFRKRELLFGLHEVRDRLVRGARPVLVEGPFDAIAINTATEEYAAVAPCGTPITAEHLAALARVADLESVGLVVALDGDRAGQEAMMRAWPLLAPVKGSLDALIVPDSQDAAGVFAAHGPADLQKAVSKAIPFTDLVIDAVISRAEHTDQPGGKLAAVRAAASALALRPPEEFARQVTRIAQRLSIAPVHITTALAEVIGDDRPAPGRHAGSIPGPPLLGHQQPPSPQRGPQPTAQNRPIRRTP